MIHVVLIWASPFYVLAFSYFVEKMSGRDITSTIGPTIATIGLGLLFTLSKPKRVDERVRASTIRVLCSKGLVLASRKDQNIVVFSWTAILIGLLILLWSISEANAQEPGKIWEAPSHIVIGSINYIAAVILGFAKYRA